MITPDYSSYETNKKQHGAVGFIGFLWSAIWVAIFAAKIAYINNNFYSPAGKVTSASANAYVNCVNLAHPN